jgi:hypothetical protein
MDGRRYLFGACGPQRNEKSWDGLSIKCCWDYGVVEAHPQLKLQPRVVVARPTRSAGANSENTLGRPLLEWSPSRGSNHFRGNPAGASHRTPSNATGTHLHGRPPIK